MGLIACLEALPGDQRRAESAHDARDIGPDGLTVRYLLKASKDGVIVEGAALDHDVAPKL